MQAGVNLATETALVQVMLPSGTPARGSQRERSLLEAAELLAQVLPWEWAALRHALQPGPAGRHGAGAEQQRLPSACTPGGHVERCSSRGSGGQARAAPQVGRPHGTALTACRAIRQNMWRAGALRPPRVGWQSPGCWQASAWPGMRCTGCRTPRTGCTSWAPRSCTPSPQPSPWQVSAASRSLATCQA